MIKLENISELVADFDPNDLETLAFVVTEEYITTTTKTEIMRRNEAPRFKKSSTIIPKNFQEMSSLDRFRKRSKGRSDKKNTPREEPVTPSPLV